MSVITQQPDENRLAERDEVIATLGTLGMGGRIWLAALVAGTAWGLIAYIHQLMRGLAVTAMNDFFCWGVYIINFVFFIGISMAGTLISAVLRLTGAEWRHPITRIAEGITVFALIVAGLMVITDMGRPDRFFFTFQFGRLQSPILWDIFSLTTYLAGSLLYLYLPLIPDLKILSDADGFPPWRRRIYRTLALGWRNTPEQQKRLKRCITVMAVTIIPVAVSIHTVTAWIFGMTLRPGWHSTIIGPDFVVGALYSGIAAVIVVMAMCRKFFHLQNSLTVKHFRKLGMLLLTAGIVYFYFTVNGYVGSEYTSDVIESKLLQAIFFGSYALQFWTMMTIGMLVPALLLVLPWTRSIAGIVTASVLVNVGMWLMRYIIVIPTLNSTYLPVPPGVSLVYIPTWVEWSITVGGFAGVGLMYVLFSKVFPVVSLWELDMPDVSRPALQQAAPGEPPQHSFPTGRTTA